MYVCMYVCMYVYTAFEWCVCALLKQKYFYLVIKETSKLFASREL